MLYKCKIYISMDATRKNKNKFTINNYVLVNAQF